MSETVIDFRCPVYQRRLFGRLHVHGEEGRSIALRQPLSIVLSGQRVLEAELVFACDDCRKAARPVPVRVLHHYNLTGQHVRSEALPVVPRQA